MNHNDNKEIFMNLKKVVAPVVALTLLTSLAGCSSDGSKKMVEMIDAGESIVIEVAQPTYDINVKGTVESSQDWIQLDSLKTYNDFRMDFDTLFNINKVTNGTVNSKSGCLYVDASGNQSGNTTLADAFRNKVFMDKYWGNEEVRNGLIKLATKAYTDVEDTNKENVYASLNAYFDLLPDNTDPSSFNASQSVTREQFYSMVFKSSNKVTELKNDTSYTDATGGKTDYSLYAQQVDEKAFLNTQDKCLDGNNAKGSISRAEAVYLVVNNFLGDELNKVDTKDKAFSDCKNAGDLALKVGFKEKKDGTITSKDNWQTFTLAYMMQNPDKGMQEDLYKAMVVANNLGLLGDNVNESRWDEPISKEESIELLTNVFQAQNKLGSYTSTVEYGKIIETVITATGEMNGVAGGTATAGTTIGANAGQGPETVVPEDERAAYDTQKNTTSKASTDKTNTSKQTPAKPTKQKAQKPAPAADILPGGTSKNTKFDPNDSGIMTDEEANKWIAENGDIM